MYYSIIKDYQNKAIKEILLDLALFRVEEKPFPPKNALFEAIFKAEALFGPNGAEHKTLTDVEGRSFDTFLRQFGNRRTLQGCGIELQTQPLFFRLFSS